MVTSGGIGAVFVAALVVSTVVDIFSTFVVVAFGFAAVFAAYSVVFRTSLALPGSVKSYFLL